MYFGEIAFPRGVRRRIVAKLQSAILNLVRFWHNVWIRQSCFSTALQSKLSKLQFIFIVRHGRGTTTSERGLKLYFQGASCIIFYPDFFFRGMHDKLSLFSSIYLNRNGCQVDFEKLKIASKHKTIFQISRDRDSTAILWTLTLYCGQYIAGLSRSPFRRGKNIIRSRRIKAERLFVWL